MIVRSIEIALGLVLQAPGFIFFAFIWPVMWTSDRVNQIMRHFGYARQVRRALTNRLERYLGASLAILWTVGLLYLYAVSPSALPEPEVVFRITIQIKPTLTDTLWGVLNACLVLALTAITFLRILCNAALWGIQAAPSWLIWYMMLTTAQWIRHGDDAY